MKGKLLLRTIVIASALLAVAAVVLTNQLPSLAAGGLLYPARNESIPVPPGNCDEREFAGDAVTLRGWYCRAAGPRRGTIVYLHGVADNRGSGVGVVQRFTPKGFDVVAYDSRRHGTSDGEICTYGYYEKADLRRVIETLPHGPIILLAPRWGRQSPSRRPRPIAGSPRSSPRRCSPTCERSRPSGRRAF